MTFIITKTSSGFHSRIIDNNNEQEVIPSQLNRPSYDFYVRKLDDLSYQRVTTELDKIRMILNSKDNVGGTDARSAKNHRYAKVAVNRLKQVAQ